MSDPIALTATALAALAAIAILAVTGLKGWRDWIALQQTTRGPARHDEPTTSTGTRIELADLKERIRKLEAIAAGVDL